MSANNSSSDSENTNPSAQQPVPGNATSAPQADPYPSVDLIMQVCPDTDRANVSQNAPYIFRAMCEAGLTSKNQLIGVIATLNVETLGFGTSAEIGGSSAEYAPYYGRGFIQLTWEANYVAAGGDLGIDLVGNPDLAMDLETAARIFIWYWTGQAGNASTAEYAERGDWDNVRSVVNAGSPGRIGDCHGVPLFRETVALGEQVFTQGLDPAAIGAMPVDGSYGLGCADGGSGSNRSLAGTHNPLTQADALSYALGLHLSDRMKAMIFEGEINAASQPEVLRLDAQKTFEVEGVAEDLDGEYTTEEVVFWPLNSGGIKAEVYGYKPDPNAPAPQVFLHDTGAGLSNPAPATNSSAPVTGGDISARILAATEAAIGRDTSSGPGGGNVACAWSVNGFCIEPAGLQPIGSNPDYVPSMVEDLTGGRGREVSSDQAPPGAVVISSGEGHVGIYLGNGRVISNSSSRASFAWESGLDFDGYYGSEPSRFFEVLS